MCAFNKMVNGEQVIVQFHVYDLKVSHKDQAVLNDFLCDLRNEFGQEDELMENKGLVRMFDYLEDLIVEAADDLKNSRLYYPGNDQLFKVDDDSPRLLQKNADIFHRHITRLLFASQRARPEIKVCVVFLCTRVKLLTK